MKLFRALCLTLIVGLSLSYSVKAADNRTLKEVDYLKKIDLMYVDLKENLSSAKKAGDLNIDFLDQVIQYHRGLIILTKNALEYGERQDLKEPINQIVEELKFNLKKISKVQKQISKSPNYDESKEGAYLSSYEGISQQILMNVKSEGEQPTALMGDSIDMDFLLRFSKQCEVWPVFMNNLLQQTEDESVKELVAELIKSGEQIKQEIEILIHKIEQ
ncbi:MAG: hypothetical protein K2G70_04695 [Turicibacter sp.]|nr:hypothetical protein [Turicibacter sp.]